MPSSLNNVIISPFKSMHTTRFGVGKIFIMFLEEEEEGLCSYATSTVNLLEKTVIYII